MELTRKQVSSHDAAVRVRTWIDKETYFALRLEVYDVEGRLISTQETVEITYNLPLGDHLFQPPPEQRSKQFSSENVIQDEMPLTIHFSSSEEEYRRGEQVFYRIKLKNDSTQSISLAEKSPRIAIGEMKAEEGEVWSYPLAGLAGAVIKPGETVEVTVSWVVEGPPGSTSS